MKVIVPGAVLIFNYLTGDKFLTSGQKSGALTFSWENKTGVIYYAGNF